MDWHNFHLACAVFAAVYAAWSIRAYSGRAHVAGALVHLSVILLSSTSRQITGDPAPILYYCLIDLVAVTLLFLIARVSKAIWAACCVFAYTAMLCLHLAFYLAGQANQIFYLYGLGVLTFIAALFIMIGTAAGRHDFGREWDRFCSSRIRGWSWSGFVRPGMADYSAPVE